MTSLTTPQATSGPPWFATRPDGSIDWIGIPRRLQAHPEVVRRGIVLTDPIKLGVTFQTAPDAEKGYVVKILDCISGESLIYQRLLGDITARKNHTLPCEVTPTNTGHPLLIMPYLQSSLLPLPSRWYLSDFLGLTLQIVEGIEFMHDQHIVHLDFAPNNLLWASTRDAIVHPRLSDGKVYIIDYGSSKQLSLGPGGQEAIKVPPSQYAPPGGVEILDPYSMDIYCLGMTIVSWAKLKYPRNAPYTIRWFAGWLMSMETGCTGSG
ncbi:kinase-like domain-containing protein [Trametes meyenii]|nr:kinase-like domain-containing protein [Trametes meyenii]